MLILERVITIPLAEFKPKIHFVESNELNMKAVRFLLSNLMTANDWCAFAVGWTFFCGTDGKMPSFPLDYRTGGVVI